MAGEREWHGKPKVQVYVILRVDDYLRDHAHDEDDLLAVPQVLPSLEEAEAEVARLNGLNEGARYLWRASRYYPEGRSGADSPA